MAFSMSSVGYALWGIVLLLALSLVRNRFRPSLKDIPGPAIAAYTKLWRFWRVAQGNFHLESIDLHKKYGPLVRIAPNVVSVGDPAMIPVIYNVKGDFKKTAFFPIQSISWQKKPRMNLFSTRDEVYHRDQKKKVANAYTLESLLKMEREIDECGRLFLERMHQFAKEGRELDLGEWLQFYAFDVVGAVTFNRRLGFLENGTDVDGIIMAIQGMLTYAASIGQIPEAHPFLLGNPLFPILMPQMESWNQALVFTLKAINNRTKLSRDGELELTDEKAGNDMLSKWAAVKAADPLKMSTRDAIVHLSGNVFAGSDTTAVALRAVLYHLIKNPSTMSRAQAELSEKSAFLSPQIQDKETRDHLPYISACIKEAMRLHPSVGLIIERHVPPSGATICGKHIPGGTIVGINPWVLHYDPNVFLEPGRFRPERWLEAGERELNVMEKSYFPFGAGSRVCIGRNISMMELRKIVPQLLREFDIEIPGAREWEVRNVWFTQQKMPLCQLRKREV